MVCVATPLGKISTEFAGEAENVVRPNSVSAPEVKGCVDDHDHWLAIAGCYDLGVLQVRGNGCGRVPRLGLLQSRPETICGNAQQDPGNGNDHCQFHEGESGRTECATCHNLHANSTINGKLRAKQAKWPT
jgi:hypothetical protein